MGSPKVSLPTLMTLVNTKHREKNKSHLFVDFQWCNAVLFSALVMWVQGLFLKLNCGSLEVVLILRWTTWWLRRLDVALQITKGTWWVRTCWKTTWVAEIGKARIITGGCFLVFSRCFSYNFSLQNKGVLWSLEIHNKVTYSLSNINRGFWVRRCTLYVSFWNYIYYHTHSRVDLYKPNTSIPTDLANQGPYGPGPVLKDQDRTSK